MTELNWDRFDELPGDNRTNFELLWRGAIWHNFARFGKFGARAQQPGVEFHLKIERDCPLGEAGRWFGWQTKWWNIPAGVRIGDTRRRDVEDSQDKTTKYLPGLTDWVLCTRRPLTPTDQTWYDGLTPGFALHNQVADDLANLLIGDAGLLREAYFGDLVLTPNRLTQLRNVAVEEVRERWFPEVHQTSTAEQTLRRMLAEPAAWAHLAEVGNEIAVLTRVIEGNVAADPLPATVQADLASLLSVADTVRQLLVDAHAHLTEDGERSWLEVREVTVPPPPAPTPPVLRRLRSANHPAALACTNLVAHTRRAAVLARQVFDELQVRIAVVTGGAGFGKTQLSAKLSEASDTRPAGILLYGRGLGARDELDKLARQVTRAGRPVESFEALLAAVDAAAARAGCRLPIVIDGLNEAESPSEWQPLLRRLQVTLAAYPSVLIVCTVREAFVGRAIPSSVTNLVGLDGFTADLDEVVEKYFDFFKIDAGGADLPRELLRQPLALRIFCSVANPTRENSVALAHLPRSLNAMFDEYVRVVAQRIDQLHPDISIQDVERGLERLGLEMWNTKSRDVPEERARALFGDDGRWDKSLLAALEQEGILLRQPAQAGESLDDSGDDGDGIGHLPAVDTGMVVAVVYDLLAGHIIASALLNTRGAAFTNALRTDAMTSQFAGDVDTRHPLASDIFQALVFLIPQADAGQLWELVQERLAEAALLRVTELEAAAVDARTVQAFTRNFETLVRHRTFWSRLLAVRAVDSHPLNATYLEALLRPMKVSDRDLLWTEWLRNNATVMLADVQSLTEHWRSRPDRADSDALRARSLMWMLTSTVRDLRDAATAALYWYGRGDASGLFALALEGLTVNDAYVGERVVAAAYGVTTAHQLDDPEFGRQLSAYLSDLTALVAGDAAIAPTFHRLTRYYIASTVEFAQIHYPQAVPAEAMDGIDFAPGPLPEPLTGDDSRREEVRETIQMDFGNYTLGRLFKDRGNYDSKHTGHRDATDRILGVVYDLGWRPESFSMIESRIGANGNDRGPGRIERYGKKYAWIGFHLVSGMLTARGDGVPWLEVDIDPTFPGPSPTLPITVPTWVRPTPRDERQWLMKGIITVPDDLLACDNLDGDDGPWVLVHAEISAKERPDGRGAFGLFNTVMVDSADVDSLLAHWSKQGQHPGRDLIDLPSAYYLFAGEIPWHPRMVTSGDDIAGTGIRPPTEDLGRDQPGPDVDSHEYEDPYVGDLRLQSNKQDGDSTVDSDANALAEGDSNAYEDVLSKLAVGWTPEPPAYRSVRFESLAHAFAWEGHNSSENQEFAYVPSQRLSQQLELRAGASSFDQFDAAGRPASKSFAAPDGFEGHLLYLRQDLIESFADGHAVITFSWGERQIHQAWPRDMPERLRRVLRSYGNVWRKHRVVLAPSASSDAAAQTEATAE